MVRMVYCFINKHSPPARAAFPDARRQEGKYCAGELKAGAVSTFNGDVKAEIGVDILDSNLKTRRADQWLSKISTIYEWIGYVFCIFIIGGIFY